MGSLQIYNIPDLRKGFHSIEFKQKDLAADTLAS